MSKVDFSALAKKITAMPCAQPVRLIGIDGGAGAGKTTFTDYLANALGGAAVIPMDDFNAFDDLVDYWPRFEAQILAPLFQGKGFRYQKRDWVNDIAGRGLGEWREMPFSPIILFEGVGACRRALADRMSYAIWIDAPPALRMQRGLDRDKSIENSRELWERWQAMEKRFHEAEGTRERADLIVDGTIPYNGEMK